jgi:phosphoglycerate dehydrogenase-like enzyme
MTFPLPFAPRRIAIGANAHIGIAESIRARRPDLELRGKVFTDITADVGNVRWIQCTGAGVDSWMASELDPSILLTRSPESFGPMIAEWAVSRIFAIQLQVLELAEAQRERRWAPRDVARVAGTRALVVGTGDIGRAIASSLHALGVHVTGVSRSGTATSAAFSAVHPSSALANLVGDADWIVVAVPDTPASRGLISRDVLSRCQGAVLLNAGRGSVVEEAALPEALDNGWLRAAALDVFATEPLPADSTLWSDPRVMVSPHISGLTTIDGAAHGFLECLEALERGALPTWVVDRTRGY